MAMRIEDSGSQGTIRRSEEPAKVRTELKPASAQDRAAKLREPLFRDGFEAARRGFFLARAVEHADTGGSLGTRRATLTPAELTSAQTAIANASDGNDAGAVAKWLRENPDPTKQAAFMDLLFQYGEVAGEVLDDAQNLSNADRQLLAKALDAAYRSGAITAEELSKAVAETFKGAAPGESHECLAEIIVATGNPDLIEAYALRELEILRASDSIDPQRSAAVATALAGLPPQRLQAFLRKYPEAVSDMVKKINAGLDATYSPALGKLLDTASRITPPTAESVRLFNDSIGQIGENVATREAAARFFTRNGDAVLTSLQDQSGSLGLDGQKKMSEFFARTLFTPPAYEGQEAFREHIVARLDAMNDSLARWAPDDLDPTEAAKREARLMGSLVGTLEDGFAIALDEMKKRNDAVEGVVGLLFSAKSLLPDLPIPGFGQLKDLTIDQLQNWVTSSLKEKGKDPRDAIPFHHMFGELIRDTALRAQYDASRADAHVNSERGLKD